ncbi:tetratricopeptide repeat protein [Streptomyces sp. NRRL S-646]|uniref:tetratricopeptide repeat protein n=1 Tax=Streptomyces sp. NRRL S-646 TaxID=1463917 RepID=UPI002D218672|nr:tetratricopeptide repeat protein [Streptomyces sp. NRRL S-646]
MQAAGDRHAEGAAWHNLGNALRAAGRGQEAVEAYGKSLAVFREFEDFYHEGLSLSGLAHAHIAVHRPADARTRAARLQD